MTAVTSLLVRTGACSLAPGLGSDVCGHADEPDIYAHVYRLRLRFAWRISAGRGGMTLGWGRTWTRGGAMVAAVRAAHRPDATGRGR
jgi:hypothetical protein